MANQDTQCPRCGQILDVRDAKYIPRTSQYAIKYLKETQKVLKSWIEVQDTTRTAHNHEYDLMVQRLQEVKEEMEDIENLADTKGILW